MQADSFQVGQPSRPRRLLRRQGWGQCKPSAEQSACWSWEGGDGEWDARGPAQPLPLWTRGREGAQFTQARDCFLLLPAVLPPLPPI